MVALTLSQARPNGIQVLTRGPLIQPQAHSRCHFSLRWSEGTFPTTGHVAKLHVPHSKLLYIKINKLSLSFQLYNHPLVTFVAI